MLSRHIISFRSKGATTPFFTLLFMGALVLASCASHDGGAGPDNKRESAETQLKMFDSKTFYNQLTSSLESEPPAVTVEVIAPFTANNIPEGMDKWLDSVRKYDGNVEMKPDPAYPASRGILSGFEIAKKGYDLSHDYLTYKNAKNYNVDVLYKPGTGEITKFVFTQKDGVNP